MHLQHINHPIEGFLKRPAFINQSNKVLTHIRNNLLLQVLDRVCLSLLLTIAFIDGVPHLFHKRLVELLVLKQLTVRVSLGHIAIRGCLAKDIREDTVNKLVLIITCCLLGHFLGGMFLNMIKDTFHHHTVSFRELSTEHNVHLVDDVVKKVTGVIRLYASFRILTLNFRFVALKSNILYLVGLDGVVYQTYLLIQIDLLVRSLRQYPVKVVREDISLHQRTVESTGYLSHVAVEAVEVLYLAASLKTLFLIQFLKAAYNRLQKVRHCTEFRLILLIF